MRTSAFVRSSNWIKEGSAWFDSHFKWNTALIQTDTTKLSSCQLTLSWQDSSNCNPGQSSMLRKLEWKLIALKRVWDDLVSLLGNFNIIVEIHTAVIHPDIDFKSRWIIVAWSEPTTVIAIYNRWAQLRFVSRSFYAKLSIRRGCVSWF